MIRAIVTDIEGTTSDIRFVHDVLFPYARERLAAFVTAQQYAEPVKSILDNLRDEIGNPHASVSELIDALFAFMDEDRKSTALKALQGIIWHDGYVNGDFTGHLYPDVCLRWKNGKRKGLISMFIPRDRSPHRNCYLATATKVILLICSAAILIPTSAPSARWRLTRTLRPKRASRRRRSCSCQIFIRSWTRLNRQAFVPCS